jgi:hypothetical protein
MTHISVIVLRAPLDGRDDLRIPLQYVGDTRYEVNFFFGLPQCSNDSERPWH